MSNKIEATGNDVDSAMQQLAVKRNFVATRNQGAVFNEPVCHGNFEVGYKIVQYYTCGDEK